MSAQIATLVFAVGIVGLFVLDRDRKAHTSPALWIPVIWMLIGGSRMVSEWLQMSPQHSADQLLEGSPLDRNILMGLIALGVLVLLRRREEVGSILRENAPILIFFMYCSLSTLWSDYPFVALKRWIKAFGDLVMVLIVLTDRDRSAALKQVFARLGFLLMPVSILLIKYYPEVGRGYENYTWVPIVNGVTTGKNLLGMISLICGLGSVWRLCYALADRKQMRPSQLVAQLSLLAMVLWLFWQADSMTALSCFMLASFLLIATTFRFVRRGPAVVHFMVASVLIVSFTVLFLDIGGGVLETMGRDPTLTGRTEVWSVALRFAGNPWFGTGFESFWLGDRLEQIWNIYWWHPNEAHNGYLEVFLNLGWIGVALMAMLLVTGYRNVISAFRRDPNAGRLGLAFFAAAVAYNLTEAVIRTFQPMWILFLLTTVSVPDKVPRTVTNSNPKREPPKKAGPHSRWQAPTGRTQRCVSADQSASNWNGLSRC